MENNFCIYTAVSGFTLWSSQLTFSRNLYRFLESGTSGDCLAQSPCSKQGSNREGYSIGSPCVRGLIYRHVSVDIEILFTNPFALRLYMYFRFITNHCLFYLTGLPLKHTVWPKTVKLSEHITDVFHTIYF